jgi:hypothetical protein
MSMAATVPVTVRDLANLSDGVVVGTITNVGKGEMDPIDPNTQPTAAYVHTPVTLKVTTVVKPSASNARLTSIGGVIVVRLQGGTVGCTTYRIAGYLVPTVGNSIAVFLSPSTPPAGSTVKYDYGVLQAWSIQNGTVTSPAGTTSSLASFLSAAATP